MDNDQPNIPPTGPDDEEYEPRFSRFRPPERPSPRPGEEDDWINRTTRGRDPFDDVLNSMQASGDEPEAPGEPRPSGRARQRIQQRRSRTSTGEVAPVRRSRRQLRRAGGFKPPQIKLPVSRMTLIAIGSVILIVLVVVVLGIVRNRPAASAPNALWIGTEWTYAQRTDDEVRALAQRLREHEVGTVYAWVSWLQENGVWRGQDNFPMVQTFARQFKQQYPESRLYGWISLPAEVSSAGYRLADPVVQQSVVDFAARVVTEFGFEGVHLNVEPVWNNDDNYLALLRRLRATLGTDIPLSVAVPPDWSPTNTTIPVPPLIVPGTEWEEPYKQSVALLVDEVVLMAYNSGLASAADYTLWMAYQVQAYARAINSLRVETDLLIGVPTYDAEPPGHDPEVENIPSAVAGIRSGLTAAGEAAQLVRGLAIYAGWTTDDAEWLAFQQAWAGVN